MSRRPLQLLEGTRSRVVDSDTFEQVRYMSAKLFSGIRFFFVKQMRNKFHAFFVDPMCVFIHSFIHSFFLM